MGCSPDSYMSPEEIAEEKRRNSLRKQVLTVPLAKLTVHDLLDILLVYRPSYPYHVWDKGDSDMIEKILKRAGRL